MIRLAEVTSISVGGEIFLPQQWGWSAGNRSAMPDLVEVETGCKFKLKSIDSAITNSDGAISELTFSSKKSFRKSLMPLADFQAPPNDGQVWWARLGCHPGCPHWDDDEIPESLHRPVR